jgi:predicted nucleotidyltransferase
MTRAFILDFLHSHKSYLEKEFGLTKIGLFGSYAREEAHSKSDVDIAVEINSPNKFRSFFALKVYLEKHLNLTVDLGIESTLKPIVKQQIEDEIIYV